MSLRNAERELISAGRRDLAKIIAGVREAFGADIALPQTKSRDKSRPLEIDLAAEWQRQSQNFLNLGFHVEVGFEDTDEGKQAYLDSLPKFESQPKEYAGKFDRPLLVEKKIDWQRQAQLAGIQISDDLQSRIEETCPWEGNPSKAPADVPYTGWFNRWGQRFSQKISPFDARRQLTRAEG